jgi:hypothetical protein
MLLAPGVDPSQQGPNAVDAFTMEAESHARAANLVGAGTVKNDIAVARQIGLATVQLVQTHMPRPGNEGRIPLEFGAGPQIQDQQFFAGQLSPAQFIHCDPRPAQLPQQAATLEILEADINRDQTGDRDQSAIAEADQGGQHPIQLVAEQDTQQQETASVQQRP